MSEKAAQLQQYNQDLVKCENVKIYAIVSRSMIVVPFILLLSKKCRYRGTKKKEAKDRNGNIYR